MNAIRIEHCEGKCILPAAGPSERRTHDANDWPEPADDDQLSSKIRQAVIEEIDRERRDGLPVVVIRGHGVEILKPGKY
jgi:hypothetical protein